MDEITIPNLDDAVIGALQLRADQNGRTVEEEALSILRNAIDPVPHRAPLAPSEIEERRRRLLALGRRPDEPFDQKRVSDELWNFAE